MPVKTTEEGEADASLATKSTTDSKSKPIKKPAKTKVTKKISKAKGTAGVGAADYDNTEVIKGITIVKLTQHVCIDVQLARRAIRAGSPSDKAKPD